MDARVSISITLVAIIRKKGAKQKKKAGEGTFVVTRDVISGRFLKVTVGQIAIF